ncbi:MAG: trimethylamine methyltransferase, partial [Desulfobacterales bacterium]|nr:trimethylamine methyltransferase [Desulfobacterales bacterium]
EEGVVKTPARLVENAVKSAPGHIAVFNREGAPAMDLGGRRAYFGTGSDLMHHVESKHMKRVKTSLEEVARAARVCDALPNIDFIMSFAHPHEADPPRAYLESFKAMAENSVKPIVNTAESRDDLSEMWEISKILRGGEAELREKPHWIQYAEPISPLKHPFSSVDKLMFCAEKGMPVIYSPAPIAGSTAPMTIAGHVVQGLAESFFGLVIHQLTAEGAPFLMGMGAAVLDMITSQCSYNAPEYLMAYMAMVEMSHYFDLPNWGYAGTSDAQIPDGQACFEAGLLSFMSAAAGSNLNHDVGYLDFGLTGSLEMVVIMNEVIDQIRRIQRGVPVTDDQIALDVISEGAGQGEFLTLAHTLKHLYTTQWRPALISRDGYEKWVEKGRKTLLDRARERLTEILETHRPQPIPDGMMKQIQARVDRFKS